MQRFCESHVQFFHLVTFLVTPWRRGFHHLPASEWTSLWLLCCTTFRSSHVEFRVPRMWVLGNRWPFTADGHLGSFQACPQQQCFVDYFTCLSPLVRVGVALMELLGHGVCTFSRLLDCCPEQSVLPAKSVSSAARQNSQRFRLPKTVNIWLHLGGAGVWHSG